MFRLKFAPSFLLPLLLVIPGCAAFGGGGETVDVTVQEFAVIPAQESVGAGEVTFSVTNEGPKDPHEFVVIATDLEPTALPTASDGSVDEAGAGIEVLDEIAEFPPGETNELTLDLGAGSYVLICNVVEEEDGQTESHYQEGMRVGFTVTG